MSRKISIGFSPCPNDTFIFDALINGRLDCPYHFQPLLADVEELNEMALKGMLDITKLSYSAYFHAAHQYYLLRSGSALGEGVGPLFITKEKMSKKPLKDYMVALPGKLTTAHLLFSLAYPEIRQKRFMIFSDIEEAIQNEEVDAGVIIHENRFTYQDKGLKKIRDLGDFWQEQYQVPIPLGGIAGRRDLGTEVLKDIESWIKMSLQHAFQHPEDSQQFVADHAQEMEEVVRRKHIETYVNDYSLELGDKGEFAIKKLGEAARTLFDLRWEDENLFLPTS